LPLQFYILSHFYFQIRKEKPETNTITHTHTLHTPSPQNKQNQNTETLKQINTTNTIKPWILHTIWTSQFLILTSCTYSDHYIHQINLALSLFPSILPSQTIISPNPTYLLPSSLTWS
jgi:hypothetical protein